MIAPEYTTRSARVPMKVAQSTLLPSKAMLLWVIVTLVILAAADIYRRREREKARELEHKLDPRFEGGPQFAGTTCAHCGTVILMQDDGTSCRSCSLMIHRECAKAHRIAAHDKGAGYRRNARPDQR